MIGNLDKLVDIRDKDGCNDVVEIEERVATDGGDKQLIERVVLDDIAHKPVLEEDGPDQGSDICLVMRFVGTINCLASRRTSDS